MFALTSSLSHVFFGRIGAKSSITFKRPLLLLLAPLFLLVSFLLCLLNPLPSLSASVSIFLIPFSCLALHNFSFSSSLSPPFPPLPLSPLFLCRLPLCRPLIFPIVYLPCWLLCLLASRLLPFFTPCRAAILLRVVVVAPILVPPLPIFCSTCRLANPGDIHVEPLPECIREYYHFIPLDPTHSLSWVGSSLCAFRIMSTGFLYFIFFYILIFRASLVSKRCLLLIVRFVAFNFFERGLN